MAARPGIIRRCSVRWNSWRATRSQRPELLRGNTLPGVGAFSPQRNWNNAPVSRLKAHQQTLESVDMKTRLAITLAAASLLASSAAFAQSTTEQGARDGARAGGDIGGPIGAMVGGTVGAAVGAGLEIPNAVLGGIPRDDSVVVHERVVVGEPLPPTVVLRPVPNYTEYRYAVVNDRRVIVEPRTRRVVKIID
ncbi:DUF1236 domain-containing protein [Bradyrhizobium sp. BR 10289]|uniref:DUF1236 domain-containing protein n=2 Tax=Bradyrhizobium TaxID=374 RepID=UPI0032DEEE28